MQSSGSPRTSSADATLLSSPAELEQLVCGGRTLDLSELEAATHYDDGYSSTTPVIRWFWEVAHSLEEAQRKRLLSFITGSDRVPIKGLAHLTPPFVISPNGGHSDRLPTAHTCFNHLLLPVYRDKETLRARLLLAIENAEGFGLM
ncbi:ubiquitin-protein ligase E3 A [Monoraphidium neglectum]|uniref:HECT-type E3 ubiquitin transferase n=1 Tax=Monoraphidium neglectum TaxID=145388 RepID=A0A0D2IVA6_9CHLO|nr:ubiquitin-protein ligase E3 A [Monoraphidium neglectum]KIY91897.1 ubiquitin-protein ligase E3 A [Monoraphidium neglectum]|eukprot:XP_013890917.1 ubiquitin-protein ligase E3 A [Monoraphidium neglectum]